MELPFFGETITFTVPSLHRIFRRDESMNETEGDLSVGITSIPSADVKEKQHLCDTPSRKVSFDLPQVDAGETFQGLELQVDSQSLEARSPGRCAMPPTPEEAHRRQRFESFSIDVNEAKAIEKAMQEPTGSARPMVATPLIGHRASFAELLVQTLEKEAPSLAPSQSTALFQSVGLYSLFGPLVPHLWAFWELTITAQPLLVIAANAASCSSMVLGLVSLTSPVWYSGDFRPYFNAFDPDYNCIITKHDQIVEEAQAEGFPPMILGVTNPYFLKTLSCWPNAIVLPGIAAYGKQKVQASNMEKKHSHPQLLPAQAVPWPAFQSISPQKQRPENTDREGEQGERFNVVVDRHEVRQKIVGSTVGLEEVVESDPVETKVIMRATPTMQPNADVLKQLLTACPRGGPLSPEHWRESVFAINDVVLRRHFRQLTESFLLPFEKYFLPRFPGVSCSSSVDSRVGNHMDPRSGRGIILNKTTGISFRLGIYDDPEGLLPVFEKTEFIRELQSSGPPKAFQEVNWQPLYERFVASPNFRPWYNRRRVLAVDELRAVCRAVCMSTSSEQLLSSLITYGADHVREADLVPLLVRIRSRRDQELARQPVDEEFLAQVQSHMDAVEAALPPILVEAVREAYMKPTSSQRRGSGSAESISFAQP